MRKLLANLVFGLHFCVGLVVVFGWMVPSLWILYVGILSATLLSQIILGYCFLSKWEFLLRKVDDPTLEYSFGFSSYYTYKLTRYRLSEKFLRVAAGSFLIVSLMITLYFRLFFK